VITRRNTFLHIWRKIYFAAFSAGLLVPMAHADSWPNLILPEGTKAIIVADQIDINRMPTRIWQFHSDKTPEQFLDFYRSNWTRPPKEGAPPYIENSTEQWKIISRPEGDYMIAVQVDAKNKLVSDGMVSISQMKGRLVEKTLVSRLPEYPKMSGSKVLQELTNHDPEKNALTVIMENGHSAAANRAYYKNFYESRGWTEIPVRIKQSISQDILLLQKGPLEASFTFVTTKSRTQVVGAIQYPGE